jgi:signal transduction histidine kinase
VKKIILISYITTLLFAGKLYSQNLDFIDSIKSNINTSNKEVLFNSYLKIGWEYRKSYPDSTIYYSELAINLARSPELQTKTAKPLNYIGVGNYYKGNNIKAFEYYNQARDSAIINGDSLQYGHSLNNIGRIYFNQGNYIEAYDYFFRSLEIFQKIKDLAAISYGYKSLAELYQSQDNLVKALEMSMKTAEIRTEFDDPSGIISIYLEIAGIYVKMENYNNGLIYFTKAYEIAENTQDQVNLAIIKLNIAKMNTERGQLDIALSNATDALNFLKASNNVTITNHINYQLGEIYYFKNNYRLSKKYFNSVKNISSENNDITYERDALYYLSKIYEQEKDISKAYGHFKEYENLKEKTENASTARQIERLESRLQLALKEKENQILKLNQEAYKEVIRKQRAFNYALITIVGLIFLVMIILILTAQKRRKNNRLLLTKNKQIEEQQVKITHQNKEIKHQNDKLIVRNQELDDLNNEKDSLLSIVAHDMKAPFHRIKGLTELLRLSTLNIEQEQYVKMIRNNSKHGMYLINDLLDVNAIEIDKEKPVSSNLDLKKILDDVVTNFVVELSNKEMNIQLACDPNQMIITDKVYLDRILDNLLSNAIKFSDLGSEILLTGKKSNTGFQIMVKDYGQGFTELDKSKMFKKFSKLSARPTGGESSNGLGLAIVKTLVDRLGGTIALNTEKEKYSEFTIDFPLFDEAVTL